MKFQLCYSLFSILILLSAALRSSAFILQSPDRNAVVSTQNYGRLFDSTSKENDGDGPSTTAPVPVQKVKCPDCDLCDGSGRIAGGIGAVAPWWPIKAYRPCPNFIDRGGVYERSGQGLDEIAFGRDK